MSIFLRKDGVIIYSSGKGLANAAQGAQITSGTVFQLASLSKPITAVAVLQLVEAGRLSLDVPSCAGCPACRHLGRRSPFAIC